MHMPRFRWLALLAISMCLSGSAFANGGAKTDARRAEIRQTALAALAQLYFVQPKARIVIGETAGYAVFSHFGMKIGVGGDGSGRGLVVEPASGRETIHENGRSTGGSRPAHEEVLPGVALRTPSRSAVVHRNRLGHERAAHGLGAAGRQGR